MNPSVRSRMWASGTAFALGFVLANYGILMVPRPDQFVWLAAAAVMMLTGALGVLYADATGRLSIWAILGFELLVGFALLPLGWLLSRAVQPGAATGADYLPRDATVEHFSAVLGANIFGRAAADTVVVALVTTVVAVVVGGFAAYGLTRVAFRGRRVIYGVVIAAMFLPLVTLVGPLADQSLALGLYDSRWALIFAYLSLTVPFATWLLTRLFARMPWRLWDAARADGANRRQMLTRVLLPLAGPGFLTVFFIVFFTAWNFLLFGLSLSATGNVQTVPAALAGFGDEFEAEVVSATMAAATVLWFVPVLLFVLVFQRRIFALLGKD